MRPPGPARVWSVAGIRPRRRGEKTVTRLADGTAGPGGIGGVGSGWTSLAGWLVAAAALLVLALFTWWMTFPDRRWRHGRGEKLALRRYDQRRPPAHDRPARTDGRRRRAGPRSAGSDQASS